MVKIVIKRKSASKSKSRGIMKRKKANPLRKKYRT